MAIGLSKQQLDDIISKCLKTIGKNPKDFASHHDLGVCYMEMNMFDKALIEFKKTLEISPKFVSAIYLLGICYAECGDFNKSIEMMEKTILFEKQNDKAYYFMARINAIKGMTDLAIKQVNQAININSSVSLYHKLLNELTLDK